MLPLLLLFAAAAPYDLVITNGRIVDGTGSPWYAADLAIRDGKIAAIGRLAGAPARRTVDARGMVVAPGFIDMLGQSEITILVNPHLPSKIFQGITTEVTGEGGSAAPLSDAIVKADRVAWEHYGVTPTWRNFREYFARLRKQGLGINVADYVGATQVRRMVIGQGMALALAGIVIGLAGAFGLARFITTFLFGVTAKDPAVFTAVPLILAVVSLVAVWLPARRASNVDPLTALRYE